MSPHIHALVRLLAPGRLFLRVGSVMLALSIALGAGWCWGASGRWALDRALRAAVLQNDLLEARASLLAAHVSLFDADLGAVARHLQEARGFIRHARAVPGPGGADPPLPDLAEFSAGIDSAQQLAERLDLAQPKGLGDGREGRRRGSE